MKIKHGTDPVLRTTDENLFVAYDDRNRVLGQCSVTPHMLTALFPERPAQFVIRAEGGDDRVKDALFGAATARARLLARASGQRARVYAEIMPDDASSLNTLKSLGYREDDGVARMYREVNEQKNLLRAPYGATIVRDYLSDDMERRFFLERYNALFDVVRDESWLNEITAQEDFARILMVSQEGLCGELLVWTEDGMGVVGIIHTVMRWRRRGIARYMLEDARLYWAGLGLTKARFDIWIQSPGALRLAESAGYDGSEYLIRYPYMELN